MVDLYAKWYKIQKKKAGFELTTSCLLVMRSTSSAIFLWFSVECCSSFFAFNLLQLES